MPAWPPGWERPKWTKRSAFGNHTIASAMHGVLRELKAINARDVKVEHDLRLRLDGLPYSDQKQPDDKSVVVYFTTPKGSKVAMPCGIWDRVEHNLHAVAMTLEAKRGIQRWGTATVEAEYQGYAQLPAGDASQSFGTAPVVRNPRQILGVRDDATLDACEGAYKAQIRKAHPDVPGGSAERAAELNVAIAAIREGRA